MRSITRVSSSLVPIWTSANPTIGPIARANLILTCYFLICMMHTHFVSLLMLAKYSAMVNSVVLTYPHEDRS